MQDEDRTIRHRAEKSTIYEEKRETPFGYTCGVDLWGRGTIVERRSLRRGKQQGESESSDIEKGQDHI